MRRPAYHRAACRATRGIAVQQAQPLRRHPPRLCVRALAVAKAGLPGLASRNPVC
jgi:hypothetical protein